MKAANVDDVVRILDGIIADCRTRRDPLGYFPAARPLGPIAAAVVVIRETESRDVAAVIDALS